jgi:hypothetical protein
MAFFANDAVNRVNLHSAVVALAESAGGAFFLVYLLKAGVPVALVFVAQAVVFVGRFLLRPVLLPLAVRFGLKPLLVGGTLVLAAAYPMLAQVRGVGVWLWATCAVAAGGELFYWLAYNTAFAVIGDAEHRGQQIAAREAAVALVGVVGPLAGAWALATLGPGPAFTVVGLVQALAAAPLLGLPNVTVAQRAPGAFAAARRGFALLAADGWFDAAFVYVWRVALFLALGSDIAAYGGAMALAGLVGAGAGLAIGRHIDAGRGRRAVLLTYAVAAGLVAARAACLGSPWMAAGANAAGAALWPLLSPTLGSATYNLAKASPCPLRFHMATEGGWDVGASLALLAAAALAAVGAQLAAPLLLALIGVAASARLLWGYYGRLAPAPVAGA